MKKLIVILLFISGLLCKMNAQAVEEICYDSPISLLAPFDQAFKDNFNYWLIIEIRDENGTLLCKPLQGQWMNSPICGGVVNADQAVSKIFNIYPMTQEQWNNKTAWVFNKTFSPTMEELLNGSGISMTDGKTFIIQPYICNPGACWWTTKQLKYKFRKLNPGIIGNTTTICYGSDYETVDLQSASGTPNNSYTYSWEYSNGTPILPASNATITLHGLTSPVSVQRRVTSPNCPSKVTSPITISVYAPLTAGSISANQTICYNSQPATINGTTPTGGSGNYSYQWYYNEDNSYRSKTSANQISYTPTVLTKTTLYKRVVTDNYSCGSLESNEVTITVNNPVGEGVITPVPAIPNNTAPNLLVCSSPTGGTGVYNYHWQILTGGIYVDITDPALNSTSANFQPPALAVSTTYRRSASSGGCGIAYTNPVTISVYKSFDPGIIGSDFLNDGTIGGDQLVCSGKQPIQLIGTTPTGCVEGSYSYQWQSSNVLDESSFNDIPGAQSPNYTPPVLSTVKYYRRKVFSGSCSPEATNIIKVDVYAPLAEGTLTNAQTICNGSGAATLSVTNPTGVDGKYTYSWEYSELNNYSWNPVYGEFNSTLTPSNLTKTTFYRRIITSVTCGSSKTSNEIKITVYDPLKEGTPSADQTIPYNTAPATLSCALPTGGAGGYGYGWQWSTNNSDPWNDIVSATGTTYSPGNLLAPIYYRRTATNSCGVAYSNAIHISILGQVQAGTIFKDQIICSGGANAETLTGTEPSGGNGPGSYTYKWEKSTDLLTWAEIPGAIYNSLDPGALTKTTYFHRIVTSGVAGTATSNNIKITVTPSLSEGTINNVSTICYNTTPGVLTASNPSGGTSSEYVYQWQQGTDPYSMHDIYGATYPNYLSPKLTSSVYYRRSVSTPACGTAYSNMVLVNVDAQIIEGEVSPDQNVCYNTAPVKISVTNPQGGNGTFQFTWQSSDDNYFFSDISGATRSYYEPTAITKTTYYRRVVSSNGCGPVYSESHKATVLPKIVSGQIGDNQSICNNSSPSTLFGEEATGGTENFSYQWRKSTDGTTFGNILGASQESYNPLNLTQTTYFLRVAKSDLCGSVESNIITITVPGILKEGTPSANQQVCYNAAPSKLTISSPSGGNNYYTFQWQSSGDNISYTDVYSANDADFSPGKLTTDTFFRRVTTSGTCGSINSTAIKITVAKPLTAGSISASQTICYGNTAATLTGSTPTGGIGSYSFQWTSSIDGVVFQSIPTAVSTTYSPGHLTAGAYYQRVVSNGACGIEKSNIIQINVLPKLLPGQVTDNQSVCYGATPALLEGTEPSGGDGNFNFQWQKSTDNNLFINVDGTGSSYVPDPVTGNIYYRRQVLSANCNVENSNSIYISVRPAIVPGTVNKNQNICYNSIPETLSGPASSGGMNVYAYQWQDSVSSKSWANVPGETNLSLTPAALKQTRFYRRVTTSGTCGSIPSNIITINVYNKVDSGFIKGNQTICYGTKATLLMDSTDVTGGTGAYSFQWQESSDLNNWSNISSATSNDYDPGILTAIKCYRRIASNTCGSVTSNYLIVNVLDKIDGGKVGDNQSICYNLKPTTFWGTDATGANNNFSYQWQRSTDNFNWSSIANATNLDYTSDPLITTTYFRRMAKSEYCGSGISNSIEVNVMSNVSPGSISNSQTICKNDTAKLIVGSRPSGGSGIYTYSWEYSKNNTDWATLIFNANDVSYLPGVAIDTTFYRRKVSTQGCNDTYTNVSAVFVLKDVSPPEVTLKDGYCKNSQVTLSVSNISSTNYAWYDATMSLAGEGNYFTIPKFTNDKKYYIRALRQDGCKSETKELLLKLDNVKADFSADNNEVILGGAIMFSNASTGASDYIWNFFEGDGSFEESPWHYYNIVGVKDIQLIAISPNDCRDTMIIKGAVNVVPIVWENRMKFVANNPDGSTTDTYPIVVYPNPFIESLSIESKETDSPKSLIITLVNHSGKVVISREITELNKININTAQLTAGVYMLIINDGTSGLKTFKIVKQ